MKLLVLSLFVVAVFAAPAPLDEETGEPVELIVNGVPEGEALEIGDILGIKVKQHVDGVIASATDLLFPLTAAGLEEAGAENRPVEPEVPEIEIPEIDFPVIDAPVIDLPVIDIPVIDIPVIVDGPDSVVLPAPEIPELIPNPPVNTPELIPEHVVIPTPSPPIVPEPIEIPDPVFPEIDLPSLPEVLPPVVPVPIPPLEDAPEVGPQFPNGEVFNNGVVQVTLNNESGYLASVQSWFNMVLNYFNGNEVTSHQIA